MTTKQKISQQAEAFARDVITKEFKQTATEELIQTVAKKVVRAMPITTLAKLERHPESV